MKTAPRILALAACTLLALPFTSSAQKKEVVAPVEELPIVTERSNEGTIYWSYLLQPDRKDQKVAIWVPDNVKTIKGVFFTLSNAGDIHRTDWQEFCRANDFVLYSALIRWADFENVLPAQLKRLGDAAKHPEVVNVPWASWGFSRTYSAMCNYARMNPNQVLCIVGGGSPGIATGTTDIEAFKSTPLLMVNGSEDPFVRTNHRDRPPERFEWQLNNYPKVRKMELPWTIATEWGLGHSSDNHNALFWPAIQKIYAARVPADADPTKGPIALKPFTHGDGWLIGPVTWSVEGITWGEAAPVKEFRGDPATAVWLPDRNTVEVWKAFNSKLLPPTVTGTGVVTLQLANVPADLKKAAWFSGETPLGESAAAPFSLQTDKLAKGVHSVYAIITDAAGNARYTQPAVVINGKHVSQTAGISHQRQAVKPSKLLPLTDAQRATLEKLETPAPSADWRPVLADDFSKDTGLWTSYYTNKSGPVKGHEKDSVQVVDGVLRVSGERQAVAMLPYDWPVDLAVEYRARMISEKGCDLSCVLSGNSGGSAFPWREGLMFTFGGGYNAFSQLTVLEQPKDKSDLTFKPNTWYTIRVERTDDKVQASVDGKVVARHTLSEEEDHTLRWRRMGLYTFGSTAEFDEVKVFVRSPKAGGPAAPKPEAMDDLASALVAAMSHPHGEPRFAASRLIARLSFELSPAFRRLIDKGAITDEKLRTQLEESLKAVRPD